MTVVQRVKNLKNEQEFRNIFVSFDSWVDGEFRDFICNNVIAKGGSVSVQSDIDPLKGKWDGTMDIHFATAPSAREVVRLLAVAGQPDSFGMGDDKTLCLWYD